MSEAERHNSGSSGESLKEFSSLEIEPLIADRPAEPRDSSRLMAVRRGNSALLHRNFQDLPELLGRGDMLVLNRSRVWKARLEATKAAGGKSEILLIAPVGGDGLVWAGLCRKIQSGQILSCPGGLKAECLVRNSDGSCNFRFSAPVDEGYLAANGAVPLPLYILKARRRRGIAAPPDELNYQTVYATETGSVAAHTAGFHFTPGLLARLASEGVKTTFVTLHIGWGTFRPVRSEDPAAHIMLEEACVVTADAAAAINAHR
ncbi:MAG: S-adenosylmethionine:tRNA ribosyltransferase-isomerase, partial [Elusimicrobiota bacterium]